MNVRKYVDALEKIRFALNHSNFGDNADQEQRIEVINCFDLLEEFIVSVDLIKEKE